MLLKLYGDVKFAKLRIGEEDDKAPMVMCGYFNLNHAASTAKMPKNQQTSYIVLTMSKTHSLHLQKQLPKPAIDQLIQTKKQKNKRIDDEIKIALLPP